MNHGAFFALSFCLITASCKDEQGKAPVARKVSAAPGEDSESPKGPAVPSTIKNPVADVFHGTEVIEDYRWLEDWNDPKVKEWTEKQNQYARHHLDRVPQRAAISKRVEEVLGHKDVSFTAIAQVGEVFFALKEQPPKKQPFLVILKSLSSASADGQHVVVDPNALDATGATAIDFFRPSPDGKMVAVSLSKGGSESGDLHFFEVSTGKEIHEVIPRVNGGTAGGDMAWAPDSKGVYYTRYPRGEERAKEDMNFYVQVYYHALGSKTEADRYELGKDFPRIAEIELTLHKQTGRLLATMQDGDGGEFAHYLRAPSGTWKQLTQLGDRHVQVTFGLKDELYVISRQGAPRGKLLRLDSDAQSIEKAKLLVPEGQDTLVSSFWGSRATVAHNDRIYLSYQLGGPSEIRVIDDKGTFVEGPAQLPTSSAGSISPLEDGDVLFWNSSYTDAGSWYRFSPKKGETTKTALGKSTAVDLSQVEVVREFAVSKDGTKVPVNIMVPNGTKLDGSAAALVTGYGGYGISLAPRLRERNALLLEQGIIVAVANLRGGGEYGEDWHLQGNLENKQNVFDDFAAVLKHMVERRYTSSDKLVIQGGSNGGLLMGATMVQNPKLVKAVVSHVGIYDMLRVELSPNGAFNVTEFGTVKDPKHFAALNAYSPYHNVKDGVEYPATFLLTGANDIRVAPMQSRKMAARLQAATGESGKVLLRTSYESGHGLGTPLEERIAQTTDVMAFILGELERPFTAR
jgi:prolyl oligopeptidase